MNDLLTRPPGIRPDSRALYESLGEFRKQLAQRDDLTVKDLRDMLERAVNAAELLLQSNDNMTTLLENLERRAMPLP